MWTVPVPVTAFFFYQSSLQVALDIWPDRATIYISPPIQFRIEWADSQEMSPLLGFRPILVFRNTG